MWWEGERRREGWRERERERVNKEHIDGDVTGGGTNVAFLSMTCQFSAIISSECPGAQVLNIQHYITSIKSIVMYMYVCVTFVLFHYMLQVSRQICSPWSRLDGS